jgi:hypothetical protein
MLGTPESLMIVLTPFSVEEVWHVGQGSVCVQVIEEIELFPFWADKSEVY